ncbi:hypothetical protein HG536_0H02210 [Torulaspora globosa]|uniref:Decapping nuclease n=1 Tax=Torulaspora globosa TaxID=48254 RepID=A0A7G3ZMW0_9SACH|nr:uncharacterized protein HG536_0H02210 [Torulaspora globosa]QLL34846.1 hypothetical protein HG536_0H02210 [Torulaspora globosa]
MTIEHPQQDDQGLKQNLEIRPKSSYLKPKLGMKERDCTTMPRQGFTGQKKLDKKGPSIPFSKFKHSALNYYPDVMEEFFEDIVEVATYQNDRLFLAGDGKKPIYPCLQIVAALIAGNRDPKAKIPYLGCNLYEDLEKFKPLSASELDSSIGCFKYIQRIEKRKIKDFNKDKITIISPRHHVVDLVMALFHDEEVSIICTNLGKGKLLFSEDKSIAQESGLYSKNPMTRKICYSGFALEDKLTTSHEGKTGPFYSIVEGKLNDRITLLLRCEMDAYNPISEVYTELKCFAKLNVQENAHRRKLLKTWIQIGLIPHSDLIIGTRDTQVGQLNDLNWYTKDTLCRKFNNPSIPQNDRYFNFNASIAVEWCYHCIESICELVMSNSGNSIDDPFPQIESFKITIDKLHNISVKKLTKVPKHVQVPGKYR